MTAVETHASAKWSAEEYGSDRWSEVRLRWQRLEELAGGARLSASFEWTDCWIKHYGDLVPHKFLVVKRDREDAGLVLITTGVDQKDGPLNLRTVHLGTAGEPPGDTVFVEFNDILALPGCRGHALDVVLEHVCSDSHWQELRLDGFPLEEDFTRVAARRVGASVVAKPSHYFDLRAVREAGGTVISALGKSTRSRCRQNLKLYSDHRLEWAESVEQALDIFADLKTLHQARWADVGEPGCYSSDRFSNFHEDLIVRLFDQGRVCLVRVWNDDRVIACNQLWIEGNELQSYQGGNIGREGKLSPGVLAEYLYIQAAFERGFDAYDFLAGDTLHKRRFSTHNRTLQWIAIRRPSLRRSLLNAARAVRERLRALRRSRPAEEGEE